MSKEYLTQGIPLFLRSGSKDNAIVILYTEKFGKVNLTIQSGKKIINKLSPHIEPAGVVEVLYVQGKYFKRLIGAKRQKHYKDIWLDYNKLLAWQYLSEVLNQLVKLEYKDQQVYELLLYSLELLNNYEYKKLVDFKFILAVILYRFLALLGYHSFGNVCQKCGKNINVAFLSLNDANIRCAQCRQSEEFVINDKKVSYKVLQLFYQLSNSKKLSISLTVDDKHEFVKIIEVLVKYYLDYPSRVAGFATWK